MSIYGYTNQAPSSALRYAPRIPGAYDTYRNAGRAAPRNAGAYPARSTALSGLAGSLWWQWNLDAVEYLCSTQGKTLVMQAQRVLRDLNPLAFTVDGVLMSSIDITPDGNFGPASFGGLRNALTFTGDLPQAVLNTIANDWQRLCPTGRTRAGARGLPIATATMAALIFIATHRDSPWSSIAIPSNLETLRFATDTLDDGSAAGSIICNPLAEGAAGRTGPHTTTVTPGGSTPVGTPSTVPSSVGTATPSGRGSGGVLIVLGLAAAVLAAGKKRL